MNPSNYLERQIGPAKVAPSGSTHPTNFEVCDTNVEFSFKAMPGVVLAAACYPVVLAVLFLVVALVQNSGAPTVADLGVALSYTFVGTLVFSLIGICTSAVLGTIFALLLNGLNLVFGNLLATRSIAGVVGGFTGFASIAAVLFLDRTAMFAQLPLVLALATLAMLMGTFGAMAWLERSFRSELQVNDRRGKPKFQFRISQLLVLTTLFAGVIGVSSMAERMDMAIAVGYWFFVQPVVLGIMHLIMRKKVRRHRRGSNPA